MNKTELKQLLDEKVVQYNVPSYIESDPIQIPHRFAQKENIEIASFLTATIAWGNRRSIIKNASTMLHLMDNDPYAFILNHSDKDLRLLQHFKHRTFNGDDLTFFIVSLKNIYTHHNGLEELFTQGFLQKKSIESALAHFRKVFFEVEHLSRTQKHVANVDKNSSCKRLNMMLRWLVRKDNNGVDFGIWKHIPASYLHIPLDVHVGNVARSLQLLQRKQNDWKAVKELQLILSEFDSIDPCKYDYALFGIGVFEK